MVDEYRVLETFSRKLKDKMAKENVTQAYMMDYCEISKQPLNSYVHGRSFPNPWNLVLIAECLGCRVNYLLGYKENSRPARHAASTRFADQKEYTKFVSARLVKQMEAKGITPEELAEHTGASLKNVKFWLGHKRTTLPRMVNILEIADLLGCTPSDILGY